MLTLKQLILLTPKNIVENSKDCRIKAGRAVLGTDENGEFKETSCIIQSPETMDPKKCIIKLYNLKDIKNAKSKCWVHCSCDYFTYYLETALAARQSSMVTNSNGNFPKIRNPKMTPYLCKHLYAMLQYAQKLKPTKRLVTRISDRELKKFINDINSLIPNDLNPQNKI